MDVSPLLFQSHVIQAQLGLLSLRLACANTREPPRSTAPWKEYRLTDYASSDDYCHACLINFNHPDMTPSPSLCWLAIAEPSGLVNLNGLKAAQKILLDPTQSSVPKDSGTLRYAAKRLVEIMEFYALKPSKKLIKLAEESYSRSDE